jgi:AAA+ ATPase superfamily predicted ATPase
MSTFPTYRGKLPSPLNPFNPLHYLWLAYWVYFRPTALKSYLYQANPHIWPGFDPNDYFNKVPAYYNLYLMVPGAILSLSVVARLVFALITSWISGTPITWANIGQVALWSIIWGIGFGLISGIASMALGVASSIAGGISIGVAFSLAVGVKFGIEVGIVGIAGGVAVAVAFGVAGGVALGAAFGVAFGTAVGSVVAIVLDFKVGAAISIGGIVGALGMIFYPFDLLLAWKSMLLGGRHPVEQDELVVLPLPGTHNYLLRQLKQPGFAGVGVVADVVRNPFQRWAVHQALQAYLRYLPTPLHFLYDLLVYPKLDEYVFAPLNQTDWEILPTTRKLLLGELSNQRVDCSTEWAGRLAEGLVWFVTKGWRDRPDTPLTKFAGMLYELLDEKTVNAEKFKLSKYESIYNSLRHYLGGEEIAQSFAALAKFLDYDNLSELPAAIDESQQLNQAGDDYTTSTPIRPTVLNAIARLAEVGSEVANYQASTSKFNKQAALLRATDDLDALDKYVLAEVAIPEQTILRRIIRQWRGLVSAVGGTIGRVEIPKHIVNPYIAGNPVKDPLFVGREDVLTRLEELWGKPGQCDSVVLYGHRRMGKSSILQRLSGIDFGTPTKTKVVDFNMQRVGKVDSSGHLLFNLARAIYDTWGEGANTGLAEPKREDFSQDPYIVFDRFLKRLDLVRDGHRFIITVDEFEYIEQQIKEGRIDPFLIGSWRATFQTYPWFIMAFAGLHNLEEMCADYWNPLYGSVTAIRVSFLPTAAATKLITQPTEDFPIDYDLGAVEHIIGLTHGQPYLLQLICDNLVIRFNREIRQGNKRDRRFTIEDVDAVINSREFYEGNATAYFNGVWGQAKNSQPDGQLEILKALAATSLSLTDLATQTNLSLDIVQDALKTLQNHDVIEESNGKYTYTVELMRRWVSDRQI